MFVTQLESAEIVECFEEMRSLTQIDYLLNLIVVCVDCVSRGML